MNASRRPLQIADDHVDDAELVPVCAPEIAALHLAAFDAEAALIKWLGILDEVRPESLPRSVRDLLAKVRAARAAVREVSP